MGKYGTIKNENVIYETDQLVVLTVYKNDRAAIGQVVVKSKATGEVLSATSNDTLRQQHNAR